MTGQVDRDAALRFAGQAAIVFGAAARNVAYRKVRRGINEGRPPEGRTFRPQTP